MVVAVDQPRIMLGLGFVLLAGCSSRAESSSGDCHGVQSKALGIPAARIDMGTFCALGKDACNQQPAELLAGYVCGPQVAGSAASKSVVHVSRTLGCGFETIVQHGHYFGRARTFSPATGELVGAGDYSDTTFGPCNTFSYVTGNLDPDCPDASTDTCTPASGPDAGAGN